MDEGKEFIEGGLRSGKAIGLWVVIGIAGAFFLVAVIGTCYLVITGKCSYCKRRRYNKKVERYKKAAAAAAGIPPSTKGSASNYSKSSEKKKNKNFQNGAIPNGAPIHATLPRNDVWQTSMPMMTPQGIVTSQGLVTSQTPPPYYVYAAPNYMTTLPNGTKHMEDAQNGHLKQGSKTLPRQQPAKLTTENLMKYQQENGGVILGKGQTIVRPSNQAQTNQGQIMNGMVNQPRVNGFATLPNMGVNRKVNGHVGQAQLMNGQLLANGHVENGHAIMNGQVPKSKSPQPQELYPGEVYPHGVMHDALNVNGSLYPIKYVDDNGQTYIFVDDSQVVATPEEMINNSADGMAVVNSNGYHSAPMQPVSSGPEAVARVDPKVVTRSSDTTATTSIQQKSVTTTVEAKKQTDSPPVTAVADSHLQEVTSFKGDVTTSQRSNNGYVIASSANASSAYPATAAAQVTDFSSTQPIMTAITPEDQANLVDFGTLTRQDGDREVKEVAVFMRWSPQLDKREIYNDGNMQYVATAHSSGSAGSSTEMAAIMPQIVVTSDGDVTVPRNNMR